MAFELQIQTGALTGAIAAAVQSRLYQACLDPVAGVYVDHLDVVAAEVGVVDDARPDIRISVPINVFIVTEAEIEAAEDPPQAAIPKGRAVADFSVSAAGTVLSFVLADLRADPPDPFIDALIEWAKNGGKVDRDLIDPPLERLDWQTLTTSAAGFEVQMVSLQNLTPGELVSFRSANHAIDVTADAKGRVMVPVFMPLSDTAGPMTLERVNRQSVAGNFRVKTAAFRLGAQFEAGEMNLLEADEQGRARLTRRMGGREVRHALAVGGWIGQAIEIAGGGQEVSLNPQPLPPEPPPEILEVARQLQGFRDLVLIPGFEDAPLAVARMTNGAAVLIQKDGSGSARVAGSFKGPIGTVFTAGNWAIGVGRDNVTAFQVKRT